MTLFTYILLFGWQYSDTIYISMSLKYLMKYIIYHAGKNCLFIVSSTSGLFEHMALRHSLKYYSGFTLLCHVRKFRIRDSRENTYCIICKNTGQRVGGNRLK